MDAAAQQPVVFFSLGVHARFLHYDDQLLLQLSTMILVHVTMVTDNEVKLQAISEAVYQAID